MACPNLSPLFEAEGREGGRSAAAALIRAAHNGVYRAAVSKADPGATLTAACCAPEAHPVAALVQGAKAHLAWNVWGEGTLEDALSQRLFTVELVGPDGHIRAPDVRVGLLLSEPDTDYPVSSHSGEETYIVLSGVAQWTVDDRPYTAHPVGSLVHHPAYAPHGRCTGSAPFLGAWRWSGDLDLGTFAVAAPKHRE